MLSVLQYCRCQQGKVAHSNGVVSFEKALYQFSVLPSGRRVLGSGEDDHVRGFITSGCAAVPVVVQVNVAV